MKSPPRFLLNAHRGVMLSPRILGAHRNRVRVNRKMSGASTTKPLLSIVVSCFNEEQAVPHFWRALVDIAPEVDTAIEAIFVDDGSTDNTLAVIEALPDAEHIQRRALPLSRNFGHEAAMFAGIDHAQGDAIVCIDADLQHPPAEILRMMGEFSSGAEIVHMVREGSTAGSIRRGMNSMFYALLNTLLPFRIEPNATDFFLISRPVAEALRRHYRSRTRFLRGFLQMIGFRLVYLRFEPTQRLFGSSKYDSGALVRLALQAILAVSTSPLRIGVLISATSSVLCLLLALYTAASYVFSETPPGYATIIILVCSMFVFVFALLCLVLVYLERVHVEVRNEPVYLIRTRDR